MRAILNKLLHKVEYLKNEAKEIEEKIEDIRLDASLHEEAKQILQKSAQITQGSLEDYLSSIVSEAMNIVFLDEAKQFRVEFVPRRGVSECDLYFFHNNSKVDPLGNSGFGEADVASFSLRIGYWSLGRTRPTIIVDEPFRNLDSVRMERATDMIKAITEKLGVQLIMVTHIPELKQECDKRFVVVNRNSVAEVRCGTNS